MTTEQISTLEAQDIIYKRRVERMEITKGIPRGILIERVNAIQKEKERLPAKKKEDLSVVP